MEEYLSGHIGVIGIPLYYVVRSEEAVAPSFDELETRFSSAENEMVARAPILEVGLRTITFKTDMMKVWGLISLITRDLHCCTYVKLAQRTRDIRNAYRNLWDHFLGPDNVDIMVSKYKNLLVATHYSGER